MPRTDPAPEARRLSVVVLLAAGLTALVALWILGPLGDAVRLLSADPQDVRATLAGLGPLAPFASIGLNVLQAVLAPVPGFIVPFVNGVVFGTVWGTIVTWVGGVAAAAVCFAIARTVGRRFAERLCNRSRMLENANEAIERHGLPAVVIARLLPGMPFDAFSYMGGLTRVRFSTFVLGTAIGSLPHALAYSLIGAHLSVPLWVGLAVMPIVGLMVGGAHWGVSRIRARLAPARMTGLAITSASLPRRRSIDRNIGATLGRGCSARIARAALEPRLPVPVRAPVVQT